MHNLSNVIRERSEMGMFSDYPHFYELRKEGSEDAFVYANRSSENSDFIISLQKGVFCKYGKNYLGTVKANMLGTQFDFVDYGLDPSRMKDLPKGFYPVQRKVSSVEYDTNFFAEKPRAFKITHYDLKKKDKIIHKFENVPPKFNEKRGCYTLNFFGRVSKASARNFQLARTPEDGGEPEEEFLLSHGKCNKNNFNLDYREPFSSLTALVVSLTAIGKKRVVG